MTDEKESSHFQLDIPSNVIPQDELREDEIRGDPDCLYEAIRKYPGL